MPPGNVLMGSGGSGYSYQASQAMMQRPWYKSLMASWGNPSTLSQSQKDQLVAAAKQDAPLVQQFPVLGGDVEATDGGMIQPKGHFVRDAIIAGSVMAAPFALPALAGTTGAAGASGAGAAGTGAGGTVAGGGILSTLKNIVDVTKTGSDAISGVSDVLGGAAKSGVQQGNIQAQLQALLANAKTNQDKFALTAPGTRLGTSTDASIIGNYTPRKVDWGPGGFTPGAGARGVVPTVTGGVQGGMENLDPNTKKLASTITDQELQSQLAGGGPKGTDSQMAPAPTPSTTDDVLGGASLTTGLLGSIMKALQKQSGGDPNTAWTGPVDEMA